MLALFLMLNPANASVRVIFCTARDSEDDIVAGLNIGADDYISKPFSVREVLARVRSVLRRTSTEVAASDEEPGYENLRLDMRNKSCSLDGEAVALTKKEFEILTLMLRHPNVIFSREELLQRVWHGEVVVLDRTIDVNITRLRRKIGRYGRHIVTRQGYGYGFEF